MSDTQYDSLLQELQQLNKEIAELKQLNLENFNYQQQDKSPTQIIEKLELLVEHFVPTEEELLEQKELEQKLAKEQKELSEKEQLEQIEEQELQQEFNQQILQELTLLNENITKVETVNLNTNAYLYILCFGFLLAFVISFIYKTIKKFI